MNLGELRTELLNLVDDDSYEAVANLYLNTALSAVADAVTLPDLKTMGTVTTGAGINMLNLGVLTGFNGKVLAMFGQTDIRKYPSLEELVAAYANNGVLADEPGDVEAVAIEGSILWYQKIPPTPQLLSVIYIKAPTILVADTDVPSEIPYALHRQLLVYGAAVTIYNSMEDGIEQNKVNAQSAEIQYNIGINRLREWAGNRRTHYCSSSWQV